MAEQWTYEKVAEQFEEAIRTLKRLPPVRVQGYRSAWPEVLHCAREIMFHEPVPMRIRATTEEMTRLEQTFEWITWLDVDERKLVWKRAARVRWKIICLERGCGRTAAWQRWVDACNKIAQRLNAGG